MAPALQLLLLLLRDVYNSYARGANLQKLGLEIFFGQCNVAHRWK